MKRLCKCHGVSGSCATQTCWRQLSDFSEVGKYLKRQYSRALRVDYNAGNLQRPGSLLSNRIDRTSRAQRVARAQAAPAEQRVKRRKLVFLASSPDYCRRNSTAGYRGVVGRTCTTDPNRFTSPPSSHLTSPPPFSILILSSYSSLYCSSFSLLCSPLYPSSSPPIDCIRHSSPVLLPSL